MRLKSASVFAQSLAASNTVIVEAPKHPDTIKQDVDEDRGNDDAGEVVTPDEIYRIEQLAIASNVYTTDHFAIYWRLLGSAKTLEISTLNWLASVSDQVRIRIQFDSSIRPSCIAFDRDSSSPNDCFSLFVITKGFLLYTFEISLISENPILRSTITRPGSFSLRRPMFLRSAGPNILLVVLADAALLRLTRSSDDEQYDEQVFTDQSVFASLTRFLAWQGHGDETRMNLSANSVIDLCASSKYHLTMALTAGGMLKFWSIGSGTQLGVRALVPSAKKITNFGMISEGARYLSVIEDPRAGDLFILAVFCPLFDGQVSVFSGRRQQDGSLDIVSIVEGIPCQHPSSITPWAMMDISVHLTAAGNLLLYLLWKNNVFSSLRYLELGDDTSYQWSEVHQPSTEISIKPTTRSEAVAGDAMDVWLEFLKYDCKFSSATLQTAMEIYARTLSDVPSTELSNNSLVEMASQVVASKISLSRGLSGDGTVGYHELLEAEWNRFFRVCSELDRPGGEALALSLDPSSGMALVAKADRLSLVRGCYGVEELLFHSAGFAERSLRSATSADMEAAMLRRIADQLASLLPQASLDEVDVVLEEELRQPEMVPVEDRLWDMFERGIEGSLTTHITDVVGNSVATVTDAPAAFESLAKLLAKSNDAAAILGPQKQRAMTLFVVSALHEYTSVACSQLRNLMILLAFLVFDTERLEEARPDSTLYVDLLQHYRIVKFLRSINVPARLEAVTQDSTDTIEVGFQRFHLHNSARQSSQTGLELVINSLPDEVFIPSSPYLSIPDIFSSLGLPTRIDTFIIRCVALLLSHNAILLASDVSQYLPRTAWGRYLRTRALIAMARGAEIIRSAKALPSELGKSFKLSTCVDARVGKRKVDFSTAEAKAVLDAFGNELKSILGRNELCVYLHVARLCESRGLSGAALEACELALRHRDSASKEDWYDLNEFMLQAALNVRAYNRAYDCIYEVNPTEQLRCLDAFLSSLCEGGASQDLAHFPFPGLHEDVDEILRENAASMLDIRAKPNYYKILYGWRILRSDFRGAAAAIYEQYKSSRNVSTDSSQFMPEHVEATEGFLTCINALLCVKEDEAYFLSPDYSPMDEQVAKRQKTESKRERRRLVQLQDLHQEYSRELSKMRFLLDTLGQ